MGAFISQYIIPLITPLIAVIGISVSIRAYKRTARTRRAEWLQTLYSKFYEENHYKDVRILLDYGTHEQLNQLERAIEENTDPKACEPLVDFLNFFEFIAGLWKMGELELDEIKMMFGYYLRLIVKRRPIMLYLERQSFERLHRLLKEHFGA